MPNRWLWPLIAGGWLWSLVALVPATNAGWSLEWQLLLCPPGLLVGVGWVLCSARYPGVCRARRAVGPWLSVPAAVLVVLALNATDYGLALRVWLCEDELRAFAESARAGREDVGASGPNDCRVGLFHVHRTTGCGPEVSMVTARGVFESDGITYWPDGPPNGSGYGYRHLYGPWYRYYDDW